MDAHPLTSSPKRTHREGQQETAHTTTADVSLGTSAAVAGLGLLIMAILAFISVSVLANLVVSGDAAKTARDIVDHELLFRAITCGFLIVAVLDVVVAWALYVFLRPVNRTFSEVRIAPVQHLGWLVDVLRYR
jgi:hypothetical protein